MIAFARARPRRWIAVLDGDRVPRDLGSPVQVCLETDRQGPQQLAAPGKKPRLLLEQAAGSVIAGC